LAGAVAVYCPQNEVDEGFVSENNIRRKEGVLHSTAKPYTSEAGVLSFDGIDIASVVS
jgi:hypothetical protein